MRFQATSYEELIDWKTMLTWTRLQATRYHELIHWANDPLLGHDSKRRAAKSSLIGKQCFTWTRLQATSYEELIDWQTMLYLDTTPSDYLQSAP